MKSFVGYLLAVVLVWSTMGLAASALTTQEKAAQRLQNAADVLHQIMDAPDKGIPQEVISSAKCIAVVPSMLNGGFIFGAKHGKGVTTCRTDKGWSAPTFFSITGGTWGLQIGVEGIDLVMVVMNNKGMQAMLSSKFQLGASAAAAAGPVGRHASAGTDWKLETEILTYSRARGVFAGLVLTGAWISQDRDSVVSIYGKNETVKALLTGEVATPKEAEPFMKAVAYAEEQSKKQ